MLQIVLIHLVLLPLLLCGDQLEIGSAYKSLGGTALYHRWLQDGSHLVHFQNQTTVVYDSSFGYSHEYTYVGSELEAGNIVMGRSDSCWTIRQNSLTDQYAFYNINPTQVRSSNTVSSLKYALGEGSLILDYFIEIYDDKASIREGTNSPTTVYTLGAGVFMGCLHNYPDSATTELYCVTSNLEMYRLKFIVAFGALVEFDSANFVMSFTVYLSNIFFTSAKIFLIQSDSQVLGFDFSLNQQFRFDETLTNHTFLEITQVGSTVFGITQNQILTMSYQTSTNSYTLATQTDLSFSFTSTERLVASYDATSGLIVSVFQPGETTVYAVISRVEQTQSVTLTDERLTAEYQELDVTILSTSETAKALNSFPSVRNLARFLAPFFAFFDDYWYYIYHDNKYEGLEYTKIFFNVLYQINKDRIFPEFDQMDNYEGRLVDLIKYNPAMEAYTNQRVLGIDGEPTYFLYNVRQMILSQYSLSLLIFVCMNLAFTILSRQSPDVNSEAESQLSAQNGEQSQEIQQPTSLCFKLRTIVVEYFEENSEWKAFAFMTLEANLIFIFYQAGLQLRNAAQFQIGDKLNLGFSLVFTFITLWFSTSFYILFCQQDSQPESESDQKSSSNHKKPTAQNSKQQQQFKQWLHTTVMVGYKSMFFGLAHSYFIDNPIVILILLIGSRLIILWFMAKFRFFSENNVFRVIHILLNCLAIGFDTIILLPLLNFKTTLNPQLFKFLELTFIVGMILLVLALTVYGIFFSIKPIFCQSDNKVQNTSETLSQKAGHKVQGAKLKKSQLQQQTCIFDDKMAQNNRIQCSFDNEPQQSVYKQPRVIKMKIQKNKKEKTPKEEDLLKLTGNRNKQKFEPFNRSSLSKGQTFASKGEESKEAEQRPKPLHKKRQKIGFNFRKIAHIHNEGSKET